MTDSIPDLLPVGLQDRIAPEAEAASRVTRAMLDVMAGHGYDRIAPPLIEYERSLGSRMAGFERRHLFRFVDPVSLRTLALRSDITVQMGRVATTRLAGSARPLRLCYAGQVLKLTAGQLRPEREMLQIGAELIGNDSVAAVKEAVVLALESLSAAGVTGLTVDFTLPDLVDTLAEKAFPLNPDQIDDVRRELDSKDAGGLMALGAGAYLPLLYATGPLESALDKLNAIDAGGALASRIAALREIAGAVGDRATMTLDPTERHGFEYQSRFGFSIYAAGYSGTIGRGGTYAIRTPNGGSEVATGFSLYPDPLIDAGLGAETVQRLYLPLGTPPMVAAQMRAIGWRTVAAVGHDEVAAALGCSHVLLADGPTRIA